MSEPAPDPAPSADLLMNSARAGDPAAFWPLAESFRPFFKQAAARLLGERVAHKVDASDVVQQALLAAFKQASRFRGRGAEEWQAWVLTIVKNQARKQLRHWQRRRRDARRERPLTAGPGGGAPLAADGPTPSQQATRRERAACLLAAVGRLPPEDQEVLGLRYFQNLPYAEIAARLGRREPAVRKLCERALRRLRDEWGEEP
jgi:RNA polymerase sigma-70 factor (ECF subfamily)